MSNRGKAFFYFLAILVPVSAYAQSEPERIIKKYSIREGLSQAVVNSITQDDKGLMWFATDDGLNRFDGYSFTTFKFDIDTAKNLHDNFVQCVFKDPTGTLWVSSRRGFYKFDLSTQQLTPHIDTNITGQNDVSYISEGSAHNLWIAWYWGGLASFNKNTSSFTSYDRQSLSSLSSTSSIVVKEDTYGLLWIGLQDNGLDVFTVRDGLIDEKRNDLSVKDILPSLYVKCLEEDHLGNIWIGTNKGLVVFLRRENRFFVFDDLKCISKGIGIFALREDSNKKLWIGTQGDGLHTIDLKDFDERYPEKLVSHPVEVLDQYNISRHTIRSIFEDKDKNLWIGTHGDGIYMIGHEEKKFLRIQSKKIVKQAESYIPYYGLCSDIDGSIWVGTDGEGIYRITPRGDVLKHYTADGKPGSITDNVVISAFKDHDDNLWFGTYAHGMFLYNRRGDSFTHFAHAPSDHPVPLGNQIRMIFEDSKNNLWVGATRGGLCLVNKEKHTFNFYPGNSILRTIDARAMVEDKTGGLWIGCYGNGLNYYEPKTDRWTPYFQETTPGSPFIKSNVIYALAMDKKNRLWIGTGGSGLGMYHTTEKTLKIYTDKDGLINNTIYGLLIDDTGQIWVSTIKGISRFDPEEEQFFNYTSVDGLQEGQFNPGSSLYHIRNGYMCFGGALGLNLFYPQSITNDSSMPTVMISGFQLFNKPVTVGKQKNSDEYVLEKVMDETEKITLRHNQSVFTFEFIGLNYNYPEKNKYAFKLEGLDRDWNYVNNQRTATYRYLPAGDYEFRVKATSQDNVWPETYASVKLTIQPPFWKTPFAYLLYFLAVAAACYGIVSVRKKQAVLRKRLRIEKNQRKRERHMVQEKLSFFTEVSHEFRTPLTLMIGPLEEILMREGVQTPVGKKLKMVYKNAHKLLSLINKLLDYRKVETGNMVLKVRETDIVTFLEEIFIAFRELAARKNIRFEFYAEEVSLITWFDKEKLEMVVNNLLSNSFKYIGTGNAISITVKKQPAGISENVVIEIRDNGIGIPKDQLKYIFDWFYQGNKSSPVSSGIGLALAKKLVYLHKGMLYAESEEGKGSVFTIRIPMGKDHFEPHEIVIVEDNTNPLAEANTSILAEPEHLDPSHKKGLKSFLIVEDDPDVRAFLKDFFENHYKIYESAGGKEGLEIAFEHNPDLIISDVMMPEMNGIDFCRQLKTNIRTSHIPVILLTAKTSFTHHKEGLEIGADAYITKPFSPEMLSLTINNLLQSRENLKRFYRNLFISNGAGKKEELASPDEKLLRRIYELLKTRLDKPDFNLDGLCEELAMSRSLLYKKIKMLTGLSPVEYLRSLRLAEAATLLKSRKYKVFEVMYMVGFSDIKYFRQCFVKEFGYPPSQLLEKES